MIKIAFIIHGKTRRLQRLTKKIQDIFAGRYGLIFLVTEVNRNANLLAKEAISEGATHIISVGGDGTLNEVVNGVMASKDQMKGEAFAQLRIGLIPSGSGNDFAKTIGITPDLHKLKTHIDANTYQATDIGLVEFQDKSGNSASRYFINIVDVGLGGVAIERINHSSKIFGSNFAYQWGIIRTLLTYRHERIKAIADTHEFEGKVMNYIVANGKYFGSGLGVAPDAIPDDGIFSVVIVGEISLGFYLKCLPKIRKCKKIMSSKVTYTSARNILVESTGGKQPIDMDGEFVGYTPMKITVVPRVIQILCEESY